MFVDVMARKNERIERRVMITSTFYTFLASKVMGVGGYQFLERNTGLLKMRFPITVHPH